MQEEGLSLLAQSNRLQDYAERKGLEVIKTFEIVESSTHGERKQFMEMINFCKKQKETIAIVADTVDRVQRSFKESVLLDELMRKDKIELHFYREGMVLNSKSTSVDIMRWDFSVMGAKAYVLQLAENVRRSNEQKNKMVRLPDKPLWDMKIISMKEGRSSLDRKNLMPQSLNNYLKCIL